MPEENCRVCAGSGRIKKQKTLRVKVPAGISDGERLRVTGEGEAGYRGSRPGDLYIRIRVERDPRFERRGNDVYAKSKVSFFQAALGDEISIPTTEGNVELKVPAGTQPGTVFKLRKKGMPRMEGGRGDHYVTVNVEVPTKLSREQKKLLEELKNLEK